MINFYEASNFIAAVVNVVVAVFILVRGCRIRLCQIWTIFAFCVAISGFGAYMATSASAYDSTFFWWRIAHAGVIMLPVFLTVFVIILVMRPFDNFLRKSLFQKKYNYKHFLKTFTDEILTVIGFNSLCGHAVNKLAEIMRLNHVTLFFYSDEDIRYNLVATTLSKSKIPLTYLEPKEPLVRHMTQSREHLHRVDVERNACKDKQIDDILKLFDTNFVIPLFRQEKMIGILFLGNKKSGKGFTQDDSDILLPLAKTLSVAVTNAQLFTELSKAQAQAAQREKMAVIGTLSAGLNHEICNPLGIARGQCELFLLNVEEGVYQDKTLEELLAKAQEIMQKVIHEVDRATLMTRKLSSFAKPSKCEILDNVDVGKEIDEVISLIEHDLELDNITIKKTVSKKLPCIEADNKQLQEIFFNIIRNAVQSINDTGTIYVRIEHDKKKVYIEIEDTGSGMDKFGLTQIFDPFFTTKDPGKGTGLGLYIVKQIVEKNNGTISVQSELGKGTIFRLVFKVANKKKQTIKRDGKNELRKKLEDIVG